MSDMTETLQDLMERRLREMGKRRGRGESISLREAYQRLLDYTNDRNREAVDEGRPDEQITPPTYEVFRRIRNGHTKITDPTASALATMLDVPVDDVYRAARIRPRLGRFELPTRADRLTAEQRKAVLGIVDAILDAEEKADQVTHAAGSGKTENVFMLHRDEVASAVSDELAQQLGRGVPERIVRVAVRTALDSTKHPELYEDVAARNTTT